MIEYSDIILNNKDYKNLCSGEVDCNAFLIESGDEVYLNNFAFMFAKFLLCQNRDIAPCLTCSNCQKTQLLSHSDVTIYPLNNKNVVVDDVKDLLDKIYLAPLESDKKIFIFKNFSSATIQSQNKLLKILEEPPKNSYIILCVTNLSKLLPTVISRCKRIRLKPLDYDSLAPFVDIESRESILSISNGSLTKVIQYTSDDNFAKSYNAVLDTITGMKDSKKILKYSSLLSANKDNVTLLLELFEAFFRDMLLCKLNSKNLVKDAFALARLSDVAGEYSCDAIDLIIKEIYKIRREMNFNCTITPAIDHFLLYILEVKYLCKE